MCTAIFAVGLHAPLMFVLAFNRDEFLERPTEPAHFWADAPDVLAGRDKESGGTWLGLNSQAGRIGFLTNCREGTKQKPSQSVQSRGSLVTDFIEGTASPMAYLKGLDLEHYQGFNLVVVDLNTREAAHVNSVTASPVLLPDGIHGVSNGDLDGEATWPKVKTGKEALHGILARLGEGSAHPMDVLQAVLWEKDKATCSDEDLPVTEYGPEAERQLSSIFIDEMQLKGKRYGTRSQTVVAVTREGSVSFLDKSLAPDGHWQENSYNLTIPNRGTCASTVAPDAEDERGAGYA